MAIVTSLPGKDTSDTSEPAFNERQRIFDDMNPLLLALHPIGSRRIGFDADALLSY